MDSSKAIDDCIGWFLYRYPRTTNALVNGEFLVYRRASLEVDNWQNNYVRASDRNTTLADLLTGSWHSEHRVANFGTSLFAPFPEMIERNTYSFDGIRAQFIHEIAAYLFERGMKVRYIGLTRFGEEFWGEPSAAIKLSGVLETESQGALEITAFWNLDSVIGRKENPALADAVARVFDSYKALFGLAQTQIFADHKPKQLQS